MPSTWELRSRGIIPVLMKFEISTPQKIKTYYLGILLGLSKYLAITLIIIPKMTLVIEETTDAET
jgi:hypothetical protein